MKSETYRRACLICLTLILLRVWRRLYFAEVWAEDGFFIRDALLYGPGILKFSLDGYFFTLQKLILLALMALFPLRWLPTLICFTMMLTFVGIVVRITKEEYAWLFPSRAVRLGMAVLLCLSPGLTETLGNLSNLHWFLLFWLALLGLKDLRVPITGTEFLLSILVAWSSGATLLLLPLYLFRAAVVYRGSSIKGRPYELGVVLGLALSALALSGQHPPVSLSLKTLLANLPTTWLTTLVHSLVLQPWLGDKIANQWVRIAPALLVLKIASFVAFGVWFWLRGLNFRSLFLLMFVASWALWPLLVWLARSGSLETFQDLPNDFSLRRYSYPLGVVAIFLWAYLLQSQAPKVAFAIFVGLGMLFPLPRFHVGPYGLDGRWRATVGQLESAIETGCPAEVRIRIYPNPLEYSYRNPTKPCLEKAH